MKEEREINQSKGRETSVLNVGDFVLVLRPEFMSDTHRPGAISKKLLHRTYDVVYQVHHRLNDQSFIVKSAGTQEDPVGFSNPVNLNRLIRASTWTVSEPEGMTEKRLEVLQEDEVNWKACTLRGYGFDTSVRVLYDGEETETWLDLSKEQYRWIV